MFPAIGSKTLDTIKKSDVRKLRLKLLREGLPKSPVCLVRDVISGPLNFAVDEELIPSNPVTSITKRLQLEKEKNNREKIDPLNHEEVDVCLSACHTHFPGYYPFFLCAFRTGMRLGELLDLQWENIDWHGKFIQVRRSYKRGKYNLPKNGKTRRVDMSDQLIESLKGLYIQRKREALQDGKGEEIVETIFHRKGKAMEQNFVRELFKRILRKAGLRNIRVHDIRHTYASLLLSDGASLVYVKEQMGHSSIEVTVDIYGHLIPGSNRESVNKLDSQPNATYPQPAQKEKA